MPISTKLKKYLDENKIRYITMTHSPAFTAQEIAAALHVPGKELAKTVIVKGDDNYAMAVLPASYKINFDTLKREMSARKVRLATEDEFKGLFPECETGAMPPFGNLYEMTVYAAKTLTEDEEIVFNAGTHTITLKMAYKDFENLVKPKVVEISEHL